MARDPTAHLSVNQIVVRPGEALTVWLGEHGARTQVELRVQPDGTREVFTDEDIVHPFKSWRGMDSQ